MYSHMIMVMSFIALFLQYILDVHIMWRKLCIMHLCRDLLRWWNWLYWRLFGSVLSCQMCWNVDLHNLVTWDDWIYLAEKPVWQSDIGAHTLPKHLASSRFLYRCGHAGQPLLFTKLASCAWSVEDYADAAALSRAPDCTLWTAFFLLEFIHLLSNAITSQSLLGNCYIMWSV